MDLPLLAYAFTAGMVATVNPCGFAMLPAYISYYLATGEEGETSWRSWPLRTLYALLVGSILTAGFLSLFLLIGTAVSLGAYALMTWMPWLSVLVGIGLIALGLWLLLGRHLSIPGFPHLEVQPRRTLKGIFLFGVAYGLASLGCTLPIFLVVVGGSFAGSGLLPRLLLFLAYGAGMGLVLILVTLSLALFEGLLVRRLRRVLPYVERAGAVLLLGAGGYLVYYWVANGGLLG